MYNVERYGHTGLVETLPGLNQGRWGHGCGSYSKDGKKVFHTFLIFCIIVDLKTYLVVGGRYSGELSSTETWSPGDSSWSTVSPLPRDVAFTQAVNLNNNIYLIGKNKI